MQTFLPVADFAECARMLDNRRLWKQVLEAECIYELNMGFGSPTSPWRNHPAVRMWKGHERALASYICAMKCECRRRGIGNIGDIEPDTDEVEMPRWIGDERLHTSHRANLLRKKPEHYGRFGWDEEPYHGYWWPVACKTAKAREAVDHWNQKVSPQ